MSELPEGRVAREPDDYYGILLDAALYGNVYHICRVPRQFYGMAEAAVDAIADYY